MIFLSRYKHIMLLMLVVYPYFTVRASNGVLKRSVAHNKAMAKNRVVTNNKDQYIKLVKIDKVSILKSLQLAKKNPTQNIDGLDPNNSKLLKEAYAQYIQEDKIVDAVAKYRNVVDVIIMRLEGKDDNTFLSYLSAPFVNTYNGFYAKRDLKTATKGVLGLGAYAAGFFLLSQLTKKSAAPLAAATLAAATLAPAPAGPRLPAPAGPRRPGGPRPPAGPPGDSSDSDDDNGGKGPAPRVRGRVPRAVAQPAPRMVRVPGQVPQAVRVPVQNPQAPRAAVRPAPVEDEELIDGIPAYMINEHIAAQRQFDQQRVVEQERREAAVAQIRLDQQREAEEREAAEQRRRAQVRAGKAPEAPGAPEDLVAAAPEVEEECPICIDDAVLTKIDCGHSACADCWQQLLQKAIQEGNVAGVVCHERGCKKQLTNSNFDAICGENRQLTENFNELRARLLLRDGGGVGPAEAQEIFKQCPRCPGGVFVDVTDGIHDIVCPSDECRANNFYYCSGCLKLSHGGQTCAQAAAAGANPEVETNEVKKCPTCNVMVVKDRGCNYVLCQNTPDCREFCWFCKKISDNFHASHICADGEMIQIVFHGNNETLADVRRNQVAVPPAPQLDYGFRYPAAAAAPVRQELDDRMRILREEERREVNRGNNMLFLGH